MGIRSTLHPDLHLIVTIIDGTLDDESLRDHVLALNEQARELEGALELADCRGVVNLDALTTQGAAASAALEDREGRARGGKLAIVVKDKLAFGMARVFGAIAAQGREVEVTYDINAALGWLGLADHAERISKLLPPVSRSATASEDSL